MTITLFIGLILTKDEFTSSNHHQKRHQPCYISRMILASLQAFQQSIESYIYSWKTTRKRKHQHCFNYQTRSHHYTKIKNEIITTCQSTTHNIDTKQLGFDSDSDIIGIDNRCSACISHVKSDFQGSLKRTNKIIQGFGGHKTQQLMEGTLHWKWDDDQGVNHTMIIPNSFYAPGGQMRLLSPQHWAQHRKGHDKINGAGSITTGKEIILFWNNCKNTKTVPIDIKGNNVASFRLSSGYSEYIAYCATAHTDNSQYDSNPAIIGEIVAHSSLLREFHHTTPVINDLPWPEPQDTNPFDLKMSDTEKINKDTHSPSKSQQDQEMYFPDTLSREARLLQYHYDFGHLPFLKLQEMARQGIIKKSLANCQIPFCSACNFAKLTKKTMETKNIT